MVEILKVHGRIADGIERDIEQTYLNGFIDYADEATISKFEKFLKIGLNKNRTLEERRQLVKSYFIGTGKVSASVISKIIAVYTSSPVICELEPFDDKGNNRLYIEIQNGEDETIYTKDIFALLSKKIPANLMFCLANRLLVAIIAPICAQSCITFNSSFWPRFNLPPHLLDGTTRLDGGYPLNGYLSGQSLDFYPLVLQVAGAVVWRPTGAGGEAGDAAAEILLQFFSQARQPVDSGMDFCIRGGATLALRPEGQLHLSGVTRALLAAGAAAEVRGEAAEVISSGGVGMAVKGEADTGILPAVTAQILSSAGSAEAAKSEAGLIVEKAWGTLDGSRQLDGSRMLDAARYAVGL